MPALGSDLVLIQRGGDLFKATAAEIAALGGAGGVLKGEAVITLPNGAGQLSWSEQIAASGVVPGLVVFVTMAHHVDTDENDPELTELSAVVGLALTDAILVTASFLKPTSGPIRINWSAL